MHRANKVIFANRMLMRLELNRHLDGMIMDQKLNLTGGYVCL